MLSGAQLLQRALEVQALPCEYLAWGHRDLEALQILLQRLLGNSRLSGMLIVVATVPTMPICAIPLPVTLQW